jgi:hypothetical protein
MSEELVKVESFQGIPVRIITHNGQEMIPLNDIADGITHDRSGLRKLFHRNEDIVGKWSGKVNLATPQGIQEHICLNRDGVTAMLMKVDYARVKDTIRKKKIIDFQEWAASTLSKIVNGSAKVIPTDPQLASSLGNRVSDQLQIADAMVRYANVDRGIAVSMALSKVQFDTGIDLAMWKNLVVKGKTQKRVGLLLATEIGAMLGMGDNAGHSVNKILNKLGYVQWVGHWALTQSGETYAEVFPRTGISPAGTSWSRYEIKWQPEIVDILRKHLFQEVPKPDQGLLTGYI